MALNEDEHELELERLSPAYTRTPFGCAAPSCLLGLSPAQRGYQFRIFVLKS